MTFAEKVCKLFSTNFEANDFEVTQKWKFKSCRNYLSSHVKMITHYIELFDQNDLKQFWCVSITPLN